MDYEDWIKVVGKCVDVDYDHDGYEDDRADWEDALMNMTTVHHQEGSRFQGP